MDNGDHRRRESKPWWLDEPIDEENEVEEDTIYSNKDQLTAFLLTFFLGFVGAGRIYIKDTIGIFKLCLGLIVCCYPCFMCGCFGKRRGNRIKMSLKDIKGFWGSLLSLFGCCAYWALIVWIIVDIILFALNEIPDGDGLTLYPW